MRGHSPGVNAAAAVYADARIRAVGCMLKHDGVVMPAVLPRTLDRTITPGAAFASPSALVQARGALVAFLARPDEPLREALECAVKARMTFETAWYAAQQPRARWPVYWAWPRSALGERPVGTFDVRSVAVPWDTILLCAHTAVACMNAGDPTSAAGHWRAVLREQVRWPPAARAGRSLPGWRARLAEPELHPNSVLSMLHVCRASELLSVHKDDTWDDPTGDMRKLGYASDDERAGGPWAEARIRALKHLGGVWPALCHLAAAKHHAALSRRILHGGTGVAEHSAGMRPALHMELEWVLARAQARIALTAGLVCTRTLGRHELGAALLSYASERSLPPPAGDADVVRVLMLRHTGEGAELDMPESGQLAQLAERAAASYAAVSRMGKSERGKTQADDTGLLFRLAELSVARACGAPPDAAVMLYSFRAL